jgi:hypothetical protein
MRRIILAVSILAFATPAFAETAAEREARCAAQTDVVVKAINAKRAGMAEADANAAIAAQTEKRLAPSVPALTQFIYAQDDAALSDAFVAAFKEQCNSYKP